MNRKLLALALALSALPAFAAAPAATLVNQQGVVMVNQGEAFETAAEQQILQAGDRVMVMEGASAELAFNDGCSLVLESGSMLVVPEVSTCANGVADIQRIGPTLAQTTSIDSSSDDTNEWLIAGGVAIIVGVIVAESDDDDEPTSP